MNAKIGINKISTILVLFDFILKFYASSSGENNIKIMTKIC